MSVARFVTPCKPVTGPTPPRGDRWIHEFKFDGWRIQVAKAGREVRLYTVRGHDIADRLPLLANSMRALPGSFLIDGEMFLPDADGRPDFRALQNRMPACDGELCVLAFDLLHRNGRELADKPLEERKDRLAALLARGAPGIVLAQTFGDGDKVLAAAEAVGLEGIVSKRRDRPYRSGAGGEWVKVKCAAWREANRERWRMFERG